MRERTKTLLTTLAAVAALVLPAAASADSLVNVSGNAIGVTPAVCANVLSSGGCAAATTGTTTAGSGAPTGNSLVNVSGNAVNVAPAVCANVLASGACGASAASTTTAGAATTTGTTGGVLGAVTGNSLVNVSGNAVNVAPAVCANVLASGACAATTTTTTTTTPPTTPGCTNCGGGVLGASTTVPSVLGASTGGGVLPKTGSIGWMALVISFIGAAVSGLYAVRNRLLA